jgi:hypothetical protein
MLKKNLVARHTSVISRKIFAAGQMLLMVLMMILIG